MLISSTSNQNDLHHGTIIRTGITCKKIRHGFEKTEIFLVTRPSTCCKPDSCFWFVRKDKKKIKENL